MFFTESPVVSSTLFLTLLLFIGLFFFVKASVKDRFQSAIYPFDQAEETVLVKLGEYFQQRAYRVAAVAPDAAQITLEGTVRPSLFLASLLSLMVAIGLVCLGLVLSIVLPQFGWSGLGLVILTPLATWFYWQKAQRVETIRLQVMEDPKSATTESCRISVAGHRDELIALEAAWQLERCH
jgi:hypothetical protein